MNENELQKLCEAYLFENNIIYIHLGFRGTHRKGVYKKFKGWPDLTIFHNKKTLFIELKVDYNVLTKEQAEKRDRLMKTGHKYYTVYDFETFKKIIDKELLEKIE
jgi:hypothetical protein